MCDVRCATYEAKRKQGRIDAFLATNEFEEGGNGSRRRSEVVDDGLAEWYI